MAEMATIGNTRYATPAMAKAIFFVGLSSPQFYSS